MLVIILDFFVKQNCEITVKMVIKTYELTIGENLWFSKWSHLINIKLGLY